MKTRANWRRFWAAPALLAASSAAAVGADDPKLVDYFGFKPIEIYKLEPRLKNLLVQDLDGDRVADVLVVNNGRSRIDMLLSTRPAGEGEPKTGRDEPNQVRSDRRMRLKSLPVNKEVVNLAVADLDADGKPDLAYYGTPAELVVEYNQGRGNFANTRRIAVGEAIESGSGLAVGDLNRDGLPDLALLAANEVVLLFQNKGTGLGEPERLPHAAGNPRMIKAVDVDGDGGDDLIVFDGGSDAPVRIRFSAAGGKLGPEVRMPIEQLRAFAVADLDGKPGAELMTIEAQSGRARVFGLVEGEDDPTQKFGRLIFYPLPKGDARGRSTAVGDVDGDGKADVVVSDPANAQFLLYRQGRGGLGAGQTYPGLVGGEAIRVADLDADGKNEVVVLSPQEKQIGLSRFVDNRLTFPTPLPVSGEPVAFDVADLDGDKVPDLVYATRDPSDAYAVRGLRRDAAGSYVPLRWGREDSIPLKGVTSTPPGLRVLDANADGRLDILVFSDAGTPTLLLGRPGGEPPAPAGGSLGPLSNVEPAGLSTRTPDGPGLLVAKSTFARKVGLDDAGQWQIRDQYGAGRSSAQVVGAATIRMDGDAEDQVVLVDKASKALLFLAKKEAIYRPKGALPIGPLDFQGIHVADFDADGKPDLLLAGTEKFGVVLTGRAGQRLKPIAGYEATRRDAQFSDLIAGDMNGDGKPEVVLVDAGDHFVEVVAMTGPGELERALSFKIFEQKSFRDRDRLVEPRDLAVGDVDGDGRTDLVLLVHDRILIYRQDTGGAGPVEADRSR